MGKISWFCSVTIYLVFGCQPIKAQGITDTSNIYFGSYIASSGYRPEQIPDNLYQQIHSCGFNAVQLYAKKTSPTNLSKLAEFETVYAANDSADGYAINPGNTDWINYFTHAKYYRWEAEGDTLFPGTSGGVGIKHDFGSPVNTWWSSGIYSGQEIDPNKLVYGPHYTQYKKYTYINRDIGRWIEYKVTFRMKKGSTTVDTFNVAKIYVTITNISTQAVDTVVSSIVTSDTLECEFRDFELTYTYQNHSSSKGDSSKYFLPPSSDWIPFSGNAVASWIDFDLKVDFIVEWLGGVQLDVDYIEVSDQAIWEHYVKYEDSLNYYIENYLDEFETANSVLYSKLKYFVTVDEPHTWDSFVPIQRVQGILDTLQSGKSLLVHFYPGWDNQREGVSDVLGKWVTIAQPKKLMFWYGPFTCNAEHMPYSRSFSLHHLHNALQRAHELQPGFFTTPQAFCWLNIETGQYDGWMYPSTAELSAETMLDLAHGVKGINYEQYFSYESVPPYISYGLVDLASNNFSPRALWYKVQSLALRINGAFGQNLSYLNYTGHSLMLRKNVDPSSANTSDSVSYDFLTLEKTTSDSYNFHAGFFIPDSAHNHSNNNYFLLVNLITTSSRVVNIGITNPFNYVNLRIRNVEPEFNFDTCFTAPMNFNYEFPAGEGYLFQFFPVVKYGGKVKSNEIISSADTLRGKLFIRPNATLTINSTYTLNDTIVVDSGATLVINSNGVVNCLSGTIINNGTLDINGGTINFNTGKSLSNTRTMYADNAAFAAYNQSWGSIIFDGSATSSSVIDSCTITNAAGIQCLNGADVSIQNCTIQDCTEPIYIYNSEPIISGNWIQNPLHNAINATGAVNEIEIFDNVIFKDNNNSYYKEYQGIYLLNSSQAFIRHNEIYGFFYGMYFGGGSGGYFFDLFGETPIPNNVINDCYKGIGAGWGAYALGGYGELGGYNAIFENDSYDCYVYSSSDVWAEFNYWGGRNYCDGSSTLYDDKYLDEFPYDRSENRPPESEPLDIASGLELERSNEINNAVSFYQQMVSRNSYPAFALTRLGILKKKHSIGNLQTYFNNLVNGNSPFKPLVLNLLASLSMADCNYNQAISYYNTIIQGYPNSYHSLNARFEKFFAALNYAKDGAGAVQILSEIQALNLTDEEYLMRLSSAVDLLERFNLNGAQNIAKTKKQTGESNIPTEYGLYQNYPNPFNPLTTIRYDLPKDSKVSLLIYDITGREVRTIVSKEQKAGRYEVQFNGSSLASGVYFYRLQAGDYIKVQKMSLIK